MAKKYDLIAIGAGSAGIGATYIANTFGLKALLIDKRDFLIGGDCLNFGCVPSKALIHIARQFHGGRSAQAFGLTTSGKADLSKVMQHIHEQQNVIRQHENAHHFRSEGIDVALGTALFVNENTIEVNGEQFTSPKIILATGSKARRLQTEGIEKVGKVYDNESLFWEMKILPEKLLIVGGGPIGCEMGQAFQRLGSQVHIVNHGKRILAKELEEYSEILSRQLEKEGVTITNDAELQAFVDGHRVMVRPKEGAPFELTFDAVLAAIGREIRTEGMGLDQAGIEVKDGKIVVDEYYRTTNKNVYAIGDAAGMEKFSHGAEKHNRDLAFNFISPVSKKHNLEHFSWVTYTDPEVATFGYSESDLQKKGIDYDKREQSFAEDDRAIVADYRYGKLVLYFSKPHWLTRKVRILGGSMIAPYAGELIQELILANQESINIKALFNKIYPYPTMSRINQKAIMEKRSGETPALLKTLMRWLYRF